MNIEDVFYIGVISKKFGYKGKVIGVFDVDNIENYKNLESVFLLIDEKLIPFFIKSISLRSSSNNAIIRFQEIDNEQKAESIINCEMYMPLKMLPPLSGNQFYFHEVEGFQVYDIKHGNIGILKRILDYPGNPVMQVEKESKEFLIPVKDEFISEVNRKSKILSVITPDGLLDIYTTK